MISAKLTFKRFFTFLQIAILACGLTLTARAAGEVDQAFNTSVYRQYSNVPPFGSPVGLIQSNILTSTLQPDGKLLVGGTFSAIKGLARSSVARINTDGTVDTTFVPPNLYDLNNTTNSGVVYSVALQSNGKIIVGGLFGIVGSSYRSLIRLNSDGSLDTTFNDLSAQFESSTELVFDINVRPDDTFYIAGYLEIMDGSGFLTSGVARFSSNGALDATFVLPRIGGGFNTVRTIAVTSNNAVYIPTGGVLKRYNQNGSPDSSFSQLTYNGEVYKLLLQPDGKLLIGGNFTTINSFSQVGISRATSEGAIDTNFNPGGGIINGAVFDIALNAEGKIFFVGGFAGFRNVTQVSIVKLNTDGTRDASFSSPFPVISVAYTLEIQPDGKIITDTFSLKLQRLTANGTIDESYAGGNYGYSGSVFDIVQQPDGKIIAAGTFAFASNVFRPNIVRFNIDGSLDSSFNPAFLIDPGTIYKVALQSTGKIIIAGYLNNSVSQPYGVFRLNQNGSRDTSFSPLNIETPKNMTVLPDDKILVSNAANINIRRYLSNGAVDNSFNPPSLAGAPVLTTEVQPDGKILIGGTFAFANAIPRGRIARLNADGTLDETFAPPLGANGDVRDIEVQADGKIIVVGSFTSLNGSPSKAGVGRLNSDGSLDESFSAAVNGSVNTVKIQPDGKILIGGLFTQVNGVSRNYYARLTGSGAIDSTFTFTTGANYAVYKIILQADGLQADGKILLGGDFSRVNGYSAVGIARLLNTPAAVRTRFDFDGDGKADVSVFRPSSGFWYRLNSSTNGFAAAAFGQATDKLAPADYDGDGRTDIAVFREAAFGYFYILDSATNTFRYEQFGTTGDVPMTGDWDGDGKADLAVYRAGATGNFYYRPTSQPSVNYNTIALGTSGDKPLFGDFDGDGKLDAAVFRSSNATWYIQRSSDGQLTQTTFGLSSDIPVPADFDGDGRANIAIFRPSTGTWYTSQNPATNFGAIVFGANGDLPVPADYDGDGKADTAVFRPSNGAWYLNRTTSGFTGVAFGTSEDKPISGAYIR